MMLYTATVELDLLAGDLDAGAGEQLMNQFGDYSPSVTRSELGRLVLTIAVPASSLWQALATTRSLTEGLQAARVTVESSQDADRRNSFGAIPPLVGIAEAAAALGITRSAVLKRIAKGTLPATKIGSVGWVIPTAAVQA